MPYHSTVLSTLLNTPLSRLTWCCRQRRASASASRQTSTCAGPSASCRRRRRRALHTCGRGRGALPQRAPAEPSLLTGVMDLVSEKTVTTSIMLLKNAAYGGVPLKPTCFGQEHLPSRHRRSADMDGSAVVDTVIARGKLKIRSQSDHLVTLQLHGRASIVADHEDTAAPCMMDWMDWTAPAGSARRIRSSSWPAWSMPTPWPSAT